MYYVLSSVFISALIYSTTAVEVVLSCQMKRDLKNPMFALRSLWGLVDWIITCYFSAADIQPSSPPSGEKRKLDPVFSSLPCTFSLNELRCSHHCSVGPRRSKTTPTTAERKTLFFLSIWVSQKRKNHVHHQTSQCLAPTVPSMVSATFSCPVGWLCEGCSGPLRSAHHSPSSCTKWPTVWLSTISTLMWPSWTSWTVPSCTSRPSPSATTTAFGSLRSVGTTSSGWLGSWVWSKVTLMSSWLPWGSPQTTASFSPARPSTCWSLCKGLATA